MVDDELLVRRRGSFNADPDNYHAGRPDYPQRVYEVLTTRCGLGTGTRLLEIGPGTGQATVPLAAAGASIVAVELGAALAERLRETTAGLDVTVVEGDFATVELPSGMFDVAAAATAFHWLDAPTAARRLAGLVRPGGWLAVWWTVFGDPGHIASWRAALEHLYEEYLPGERRDPTQLPAPMRVADRSAELSIGGWFGTVTAELIRWQHRLTPDAARALWATFPNVRELDPARREGFLTALAAVVAEQPDGMVSDNYVTALYTAQRTPVDLG